MPVLKGEVYLADLEPRRGTEPGKIRPVVVVQTNLLNGHHPSTIICPISTNVHSAAQFLRVHLKKTEGGLLQPSDVLVDQVRAIDNRRFVRRLGKITSANQDRLHQCLITLLS